MHTDTVLHRIYCSLEVNIVFIAGLTIRSLIKKKGCDAGKALRDAAADLKKKNNYTSIKTDAQ